jgi:hypothetical protein
VNRIGFYAGATSGKLGDPIASGQPVSNTRTPMRYELPEKKKLIHEMTIPIRWGDMDA